MRLKQPGTIGTRPRGDHSRPGRRWRRLRRLWIAVLGLASLAGLAAGSRLAAQEPAPGASSAAAAGQPPAATAAPHPPGRYVLRDRLILYIEFAGMDAHAEAWKKTAAYKMLTTTPLGEMLEEVCGQLLERLLGEFPGRKLSGSELVTLCKSALRGGWVLAIGKGLQDGDPLVGTLVLRGAATKENKPVSSRLLGTMMGTEAKPRIERKSGRVLVVVPSGGSGEGGWVWWPEKEDLVIGFLHPSNAEAILAALDGKSPSSADHPLLKQLGSAEGTFQPVMTAFLDPAAVPSESGNQVFKFLGELQKNTGLTRVDYRWGFDDDALQSVTRLVSQSPRKGILTIFDQPRLDPQKLIPIPEGVDAFAMLSVTPAKVIEAISQLEPSGASRAKIEELFEKARAESRVDPEKDLLGNLGPRMAFYVTPGRSAAAGDESPVLPAAGTDPLAMFSTLQGTLPKPTLVAEVRDPAVFARALDAVMIAVNKELKAQAIEKAAQEPEAAAPAGAGAPGPFRGRGEGAAERPARKRSSRETPAPEFRLMPGPIKTYMLSVPADSPLKLGAAGVRPTVRLDGKFVAFASSSEAARAGLDAAKKKDWRPSPDVEQALSHAPSGSVFLAVGDPRETVPAILASLPGTLQTAINTTIAMSAQAPETRPAGAAGGAARFGPGGGAGGPPFGPGTGAGAGGPPLSSGAGAAPGRGGRRSDEEGGRPGQIGPPGGYMGIPGPPGTGRPGAPGQPGGPGGAQSAQASMIQIKVDPSKLPKAEDLKALMFPGTIAIAVDDQSIRLVNRQAFPNVVNGAAVGGIAGALLMPAIQAARNRAQEFAASNAAKGAEPGIQPAQTGASGPPGVGPGPAGARPPGPAAKGGPAGPRGRGARALDD